FADEGPGHDQLAAFLSHRRERQEGTRREDAGLLAEFALRRVERFLALFDQPFRNRPDPGIAIAKERAAGMHQEEFQGAVPPAIHQQTCADKIAAWACHFTISSSVIRDTA